MIRSASAPAAAAVGQLLRPREKLVTPRVRGECVRDAGERPRRRPAPRRLSSGRGAGRCGFRHEVHAAMARPHASTTTVGNCIAADGEVGATVTGAPSRCGPPKRPRRRGTRAARPRPRVRAPRAIELPRRRPYAALVTKISLRLESCTASRASMPPPRSADARIPAAGAVSSVGRAPARQAGGHWFEPSTAHPQSLGAKRLRAFFLPEPRCRCYQRARPRIRVGMMSTYKRCLSPQRLSQGGLSRRARGGAFSVLRSAGALKGAGE